MPREDITQHELTDEDVARLVTESLAWDSQVHYPHIDVTVDEGIVVLNGVVERLVEKMAAESDASRVPGVTQVINNLAVRPQTPVSDSGIQETVKREIEMDARVPGGDFDVLVKDGFVHLRGEVVEIGQKRAAIDDAALVYGVRGIVDEISVLPQESNHHMLEELVSAEIARAPMLDERRIHPHVEDGVVHLRGNVDFLYQKQEAERIAGDVPGVKEVRNGIEIAG